MWDVERIQDHIARELPLATLFGIEILSADSSSARVRLNGNTNIVRPGGTIAGPVLFALADIAAYASTLMTRQNDLAVTATSSIYFLRAAHDLPIVANATVLRTGRNTMSVDVRIWAEASGNDQLVAVATALWSGRTV